MWYIHHNVFLRRQVSFFFRLSIMKAKVLLNKQLSLIMQHTNGTSPGVLMYPTLLPPLLFTVHVRSIPFFLHIHSVLFHCFKAQWLGILLFSVNWSNLHDWSLHTTCWIQRAIDVPMYQSWETAQNKACCLAMGHSTWGCCYSPSGCLWWMKGGCYLECVPRLCQSNLSMHHHIETQKVRKWQKKCSLGVLRLWTTIDGYQNH